MLWINLSNQTSFVYKTDERAPGFGKTVICDWKAISADGNQIKTGKEYGRWVESINSLDKKLTWPATKIWIETNWSEGHSLKSIQSQGILTKVRLSSCFKITVVQVQCLVHYFSYEKGTKTQGGFKHRTEGTWNTQTLYMMDSEF